MLLVNKKDNAGREFTHDLFSSFFFNFIFYDITNENHERKHSITQTHYHTQISSPSLCV